MKINPNESVVDIANRIVPLRIVLGMTNIYVSEFTYGKSIKTRCPFADIYHLTEDAGKSMRVYSDTNTAFCYMGCGVLTPVSVYAKLNGVPYKAAAKFLLEKVGHKLKTFDEKWADAVNGVEPLNLQGYRDALNEICTSYSKGEWSSLKYSPSVSSSFSKLLEILDKASSYEDADRWLATARQLMLKKIDEEKHVELSQV
jgi:hypothetical protein